MAKQSNELKNMMASFFQMQNPSGSGSVPSNTVANPRGDLKVATTRSGVSYDGPSIPPTSSFLPKEVECESEVIKDKVQTINLGSTTHVQPLVVQVPIQEPEVVPKPFLKPSIPYPSRLNDQKLHEKANYQMLKFLQIFQRLHFDLSFVDALLHIPKFASTFKILLSNKEKLFELANTPLNKNCLKKLSLPELTPTRMTLELANRSVAYPVGVAEDVFVKVGKFHFPADFVVVDYDVDPRVPLILGRPFLRTARALIDVHREELILRDGDEQLIFHVDNTSKHPHESINMINFIDITCDDHFSEVLKFNKSNHPSSGSTTPFSDSLLEEFADELTLLDPFPPGDEDDNFDLEAELRKIEYLLNQDLSTESSPKTDTSIAITPILPTVEPEDSLIMGDKDLFTISEKELDELIKSSVEDLVPIPRESEDTSDNDKECDLPFYDNFVTLFDLNDDFTSSDDESFPKEDVQEENFKFIRTLFLYLMTNIDVSTDIEDGYYDSEGDIIYLESLLINDTIPNLPPEVFFDHDPRSLKDEHDNDNLKSMVKVFDPGIHEKIISPTYVRITFEDHHYLSLIIFLPFLTYLVNSLLFSSGSDDIVFDPDISVSSFYSLKLAVSHQSGTFICFNVYLNIMNESPMEIYSSTCFVPNITMIWGESS
ncbi:reverse transcriptase domain-containing protein [Tanacetum coccineum]